MSDIKRLPIGFAEMYEWVNVPAERYARFVQFSKKFPGKIELLHDADAVIVGVCTPAAAHISNDPEEWHAKYVANETGDLFLRKERLAVGIKQYDQTNEFSYISTRPWEHIVNVVNKNFDEKKKYVPRSMRSEWAKVCVARSVIVKDNGTCMPGDLCTPICSDFADLAGTVEKANIESKHRFYVLKRISPTTVMILNKEVV